MACWRLVLALIVVSLAGCNLAASDEERAAVDLTLLPAQSASSQAFFASPAGAPSGTGSVEQPWSLSYALSHPDEVMPGDTIWLLGGEYTGLYQSSIQGAPEAPILVRAAPGSRVVLDPGAATSGVALTIAGAHAWFWGLEIANPSHRKIVPGPQKPSEIDRAVGVHVTGQSIRLINLVVHDIARGISIDDGAADAEIYGTLLYYCGWADSERGYGPAVFVRGTHGRLLLEDNIQFAGFSAGLRAMGPAIEKIELRGNAFFNSGALRPGERDLNYIISSVAGVREAVLEDNHSYFPLTADGGRSNLGWVYGDDEVDVVVRGNRWVGGASPLELWRWQSAEVVGNVFVSRPGKLLAMVQTRDGNSELDWSQNRYYGSDLFRLNGKKLRWNDWRTQSGLDGDSQQTGAQPEGVEQFVRANRYEPGRAHAVIYDWEGVGSVRLDLSGAVEPGVEVEIRDAQNFFGAPLAVAKYNGEPIAVDLPAAPSMAKPAGSAQQPGHSGPEFWVLIVVPKTKASTVS